MLLASHKWLADENIPPGSVAALKTIIPIISSAEAHLLSADDILVLAFATEQNRIVLTQDSDFGTLAFSDGLPFLGIVFLRPGNYSAEDCTEAIRTLLETNVEITAPFMIVVTKRRGKFQLRIRNALKAARGDSMGP